MSGDGGPSTRQALVVPDPDVPNPIPATTRDELSLSLIVEGSKSELKQLTLALVVEKKAELERELAEVRLARDRALANERRLELESVALRKDLAHRRHDDKTSHMQAYLAGALATVGGALLSESAWFSVLIIAGVALLGTRSIQLLWRNSEAE